MSKMYYISTLTLCLLLTAVDKVAFADREDDDKSDEGANDQDLSLSMDNNSTIENATPDSHEAMNNREMEKDSLASTKSREKRSYEFLMGLINNNSKYEITRSESTLSKKQQKDNIEASEQLLELMVKIVAHPFEWEKVHNLLKKLDEDLTTSKKIVDNFNNFHNTPEPNLIEVQTHKKSNANRETLFTETVTENPRTEAAVVTKEKKTNHSASAIKTNNWPVFDSENTRTTNKYQWQDRSTKNTYPHNFAYHRVTGRPLYLNKNPKAYIAVSVIAPKPLSRTDEEDVTLENELRQLKPWTHKQNLKNMASIRSRWIIQTDEEKKEEPPSP